MLNQEKKTQKKRTKWTHLRSIGIFNLWRIRRRKNIKHIHIDNKVAAYIEHVSELSLSPAMKDLRQATESLPMANMQIDANQAAFLKFLIQTVHAKRILEIGTFRGYSAAIMADETICELITTIEARKESAEAAKRYWDQFLPSHTKEKINLIVGEARQQLDTSEKIKHEAPYDLIFIDADKTGYSEYFEKTRSLIRQGGLIVFDNMLNAGLVATSAHDKTTNALRDLNLAIFTDSKILSDFDPYLIPAWDGVVILRTNSE